MEFLLYQNVNKNETNGNVLLLSWVVALLGKFSQIEQICLKTGHISTCWNILEQFSSSVISASVTQFAVCCLQQTLASTGIE